MKLRTFIAIACLFVVPLGRAADKNASYGLPSDVANFKECRDLCDYFCGEDLCKE